MRRRVTKDCELAGQQLREGDKVVRYFAAANRDPRVFENPEKFDLHRPYADDIVLVSDSGQPMRREADLIDVWFDSGAMPFAQWHYPFENKDRFESHFPADFIAEGLDQTRGWFYTLNVISTIIKNANPYKNLIVNGLVLAEDGKKMSKRLKNY